MANPSNDIFFPCDQCDDSFASSKDLMAHIREADDHEAICKACDTTFKNFDNLRHHKRKYHYEKLESAEFICDTCGKCCKTRELLKDHWNFVHKVEPDLNCNLCGRNCQNMLKLKKHMKMCLSRDPDIVAQERLQFEATNDSKCQATFGYQNLSEANTLGSGMKPSEEMDEKTSSVFCSDGEDEFPFLSNKSKSDENSDSIKKEVSVSEELEFDVSHLAESKLKGDSKSEEKEELNKMNELEDLVKLETEPDIDIDDLIAPVKKRRIRNKIPIVAKVCPICAKEVKYLNGHIKDVHTEAPPENHICNHCGKVFSKIKKLRGHIDAAHKVQPSMCDICSQVFKNLHSLRGHKRKVHEEVSEVTCPSCFKLFDTKLKLYYHERAVHTLEDSKCQACGRTYKNKNLLQKHQKVYHKDLYEDQKNYFEHLNSVNIQNSSQPVHTHSIQSQPI